MNGGEFAPGAGLLKRAPTPPAAEPASIAEMLGTVPVPVRVFDDFPGAGGRFLGRPIALRALSGEEVQRCYADALRWLTAPTPNGCGWSPEQLYTELGEAARDYEVKVQHLARAWVRAHDTTQAQDTVDNVRRLLEPDEVAALYERLLDWMNARSPLAKLQSGQEVEDTADALLKGLMPPSWVQRCAPSTLRAIVPALVARANQRTRPPSGGTSTPTSSFGDSASAPDDGTTTNG